MIDNFSATDIVINDEEMKLLNDVSAIKSEYPQYFSRLFKKKTGISPKEYIESAKLNAFIQFLYYV